MGSTLSSEYKLVNCDNCHRFRAVYRGSMRGYRHEIRSFFRRTIDGEYQFTSCRWCATDYVKQSFHHVPGGWKENSETIQKYECIC